VSVFIVCFCTAVNITLMVTWISTGNLWLRSFLQLYHLNDSILVCSSSRINKRRKIPQGSSNERTNYQLKKKSQDWVRASIRWWLHNVPPQSLYIFCISQKTKIGVNILHGWGNFQGASIFSLKGWG